MGALVKSIVKAVIIVLLVLSSILLILLFPKDMEVTVIPPNTYEVDYEFSFKKYWEGISVFINHFQTEGGFGENKFGVPILETVQEMFPRSLKIIIPTFFMSLIVGILLGIIQFYLREKWAGKLMAFITWVFSSIPDFFLYILAQIFIVWLFELGFPKFKLYGHEQPYSWVLLFIALSIYPIVHMIKYTFVTLLNEASQEYILTAKSKGLSIFKVYIHMLSNCLQSIFTQFQVIMLYIVSSLPIIEYLSGYRGAGYELLESIKSSHTIQSFAFLLPFLLLMFLAVGLSKVLNYWVVPKGGTE